MKISTSYLRKRFLTGLFVLLPIGITFWIIAKVFNVLDSALGVGIYNLIGMKIPGLGLMITLVFIFIVGIVTNNVLGRKLTEWLERLFVNLPVIKTIYIPIKDILKNFSSDKSNNFKKAVFVTYPMEGSHSIGFITKEDVDVNGEIMTTIFIPTTPNPTSGFLVYLKPDKYVELDMPVEVALKTIISLGSISPDVIKKK